MKEYVLKYFLFLKCKFNLFVFFGECLRFHIPAHVQRRPGWHRRNKLGVRYLRSWEKWL